MSLKKSLEEVLRIKGTLSRDELRKYGKNLPGMFDSATVDRKLRELASGDKPAISPLMENGFITRYYFIYEKEQTKLKI